MFDSRDNREVTLTYKEYEVLKRKEARYDAAIEYCKVDKYVNSGIKAILGVKTESDKDAVH